MNAIPQCQEIVVSKRYAQKCEYYVTYSVNWKTYKVRVTASSEMDAVVMGEKILMNHLGLWQ